MLQPNQRVVMITGANRGIGYAIAKALQSAGYQLSLGVRNTAAISDSFSGDTLVHNYDARDPQAPDAWVASTLEHFGAVDAVVLNAGVLRSVGIVEGSEEELDLMWKVNFKGPLRLIRAALPVLKKCVTGRVINIASLSGKRVLSAGNLGYCASKFASLALTHALREEGWSDGLRATAICPGLVDTDMVAEVETPAGQFKITPEAIAATALYALSLPNDATVAEILVNSRLEPAI